MCKIPSQGKIVVNFKDSSLWHKGARTINVTEWEENNSVPVFSPSRSSFCAPAVFLGFISCHLQCLHAWYNPAFIPLYVIVSFPLAGVRWRLCICILEWMAQLSYRDLISLKRGSHWLFFFFLYSSKRGNFAGLFYWLRERGREIGKERKPGGIGWRNEK